jgi:protein-L-isoaspartate O-methyltransferase
LIPVGRSGRQALVRVTRHGDEFKSEELLPVSFVPLLGGTET